MTKHPNIKVTRLHAGEYDITNINGDIHGASLIEEYGYWLLDSEPMAYFDTFGQIKDYLNAVAIVEPIVEPEPTSNRLPTDAEIYAAAANVTHVKGLGRKANRTGCDLPLAFPHVWKVTVPSRGPTCTGCQADIRKRDRNGFRASTHQGLPGMFGR